MAKSLQQVDITDPYVGKNPRYKIYMWKGNASDKLETPMPENWSTSLDIGWQPQFATLIQDAAGVAIGQGRASALANIAAAGGFQIQNKLLASNIWQGTSYLNFTILFVFKVESDAKKELVNPIKRIMKWALPTTGNGNEPGVAQAVTSQLVLKAPYAPFTKVEIMGKNSTKKDEGYGSPVSVQFGRFFILPSCVITNISQTYDSMLDADGIPLSAKIDVSVQSTTIITAEDISQMFLL